MANGTSAPALQGRARLLELAAAAAIPLNISKPPLSGSPCPKYGTAADTEHAEQLLAERRLVDPEYKRPTGVSKLLKKKAEIEAFSYKEKNRALTLVVEEGGPLGLVEALIDLGANVNVFKNAHESLARRMVRRDREEIRNDILCRAVKSGEPAMVRLLASKADERNLDDSLQYAIERGHLEITKVLLEYGADPTEYHEQFLAKIDEAEEDLVELLMQGPKRPCLECRAKGLAKAIGAGSLRIAVSLLLNEADADYQTASALQRAMKIGRTDLAVAIATIGQKPPSAASLDLAISAAYRESSHGLEKIFALIEICLCAGAAGDHCAETLLKAAQNNQDALVHLLLLNGASVNYHGGAVIKHSILEERKELLADLLKKSPTPLSLSNAVEAAMTLEDLSAIYEVTEMLLAAGASGVAVAHALIEAVNLPPNSESYNIIQLLVERGAADINFDDGKAIQLTAGEGRIDVLQILLRRQPNPISLNAAFSHAMGFHDASIQELMVKMLLESGATGRVVDEALVTAVQKGVERISLATLILTRASVDFENGKALCEAVRIRCFELIQLLLTVRPSYDALTSAWAEAVTVNDDDFQFKTFQTLLGHGMKGDPVSQSLVVAAIKGTPALDLCRLLLQHGTSVDYNNGEALVNTIQRGHLDILAELLSAKPSQSSLESAIAAAQELKGDARLQAVTPILKVGVSQDVRDAGLLQAVQEQPYDSRLIQLFLDAKASPEFSKGSSFLHATRNLDLGLLNMLAPSISSKEVLLSAFEVVFQEGEGKWRTEGLAVTELLIRKGVTGEHVDKAAVKAASMFDMAVLELVAGPVSSVAVFSKALAEATTRNDWVLPEGLTTIQFLLEKGASGSGVDEAVIASARGFDFESLQLLSNFVTSPEVYTRALSEGLGFEDEWLQPENMDCIELLLDHGAGGEPLHVALVQAIDAYANDTALIDLLLHFKANVNYDEGQSMQAAASSGDTALLKTLLSHGPNQDSISRAFSVAIASGHKEDVLIALIDTFIQSSVKPDVNFVYPEMDSPLILGLQLYPESPAVVKRLCDIGFPLEAEMPYDVDDDEFQELESVTPLAWALFQPESMISTDVVLTLLEAKANPNFVTKDTKITPLHIAAKYERPDIVASLLKHGAQVIRDSNDRSALFYASRNGDIKSMTSILKAKPAPGTDDGSLQEAARELYPAAVKLLIKHDHHPDFTSTKHDGRTALAELALCCDGSSPDVRIDDTIDALIKGNAKSKKADPLKKCLGKTPLYLALENPSPLTVVQKLLERVYWNIVNDSKNLYVEDDIFYSPTMYVKKGFLPLSEPDTENLLKLLRSHEAADIYYANLGQEQPPDAVNMPEKIATAEQKKIVREQKKRHEEEDHRDKLRREAEAMGQKINLKEDMAEADLQMMAEKHALKFDQSAAVNRQRLEADAAKKLLAAQAAREKLAVQQQAAQNKLAAQQKAAQIKAGDAQTKVWQQREVAKVKVWQGDSKVNQQIMSTKAKVAAGDAKVHQQIKAARVKAAAGDVKVQQKAIMERTSVKGKLVQHKIKMEELEAKRQAAKMKRLQ